ncbi:MAG: hypothetical protein EAX95_11990 [Candidatus Thorarchaeota archaeon]|nr:hypothetical protein [Candidatus Thorarchaeota archaeon]
MSSVQGAPNALFRSLLKLLLFLVVPMTIIYYEWSGYVGALNILYSSRIFTFTSTTIVGDFLPFPGLEFYWVIDEMTATAIVTALPGFCFNYRVIRANRGQSLRRPMLAAILVTIVLDYFITTLVQPSLRHNPMRYTYFYTSTNTPWILILFIFFPMILRQATLLDMDSHRPQGAKRHFLPTRNWVLALVLGSLVTLVSPAIVAYNFGGAGETVFTAGFVSSVGVYNYTWEYLLMDWLVQFSYYGVPYPLDLGFLALFFLEFYFTFEALRFLRGQVSRRRAFGLALSSWVIAYSGLAILFAFPLSPEMSLLYQVIPFPVIPILGTALLVRKQPLHVQDQEFVEVREDEASEEGVPPGEDERAPGVTIPLHYILLSRLKESRLNVFKREF